MDLGSPLKGELFCTTHVDIRTETQVREYIQQLGGEYRPTLEKSTTFLIVGKRWTEKYDYAVAQKERKISQDKPSPHLITFDKFVKVRESWLAGDDIDVVGELIKMHLDVFEKMIVCFTNMTDQDRESTRIMVEERGGKLRRQLTRACTVLVSPLLTGKKVDGARVWQIPVVHPKWIVDSLRAGAAINPSLYSVEMDVKDMGNTRQAPRRPSSSASASAASVQPSSILTRKDKDWGSFSMRKPPGRTVSNSSGALDIMPPPSIDQINHAPAQDRASNDTRQGIFADLSFKFLGYNQRELTILQRTISSHMATVSVGVPDYLVLNSKKPNQIPLNESEQQPAGKIITEWAVERSLHYKKPLLDDIWGQPVFKQPCEGLMDLNVSVTGFTGIELRHITELLKLTGAKFNDTLTPERDLLIAATETSNKVAYAKQWQVPIAKPSWVWRCALAGEIQAIDASESVDGQAHAVPVHKRPSSAANGAYDPEAPKKSPHKRASVVSPRSTNSVDAQRDKDDLPSTQVGYADEGAKVRAELLQAMGEESQSVNIPEPTSPLRRVRQLRARYNE